MSYALKAILAKDLSDVFGLESMAEDERESFLIELGEVVMERVVFDHATLMTSEENEAFASFIQSLPAEVDLLEAVAREYPSFMAVLEQTLLTYKADAIALDTTDLDSGEIQTERPSSKL